MDATRQLELHGTDYFFYYSNSFTMFLLAAGMLGLAGYMSIREAIGHPPANFNFGLHVSIAIATISLLLGAQLHHGLTKQLRFQVFHTSRGVKSNYRRVKGALCVSPWTITVDDENREIQCRTGMSLFSWGDRVTIYFEGQDVFINSICEPQWGGGGLFGPRSRNIQVISSAIT